MADPASFLPPHLARYVVPQDYAAYTPRDQAVWRHILTRLTSHLADRAHPSYLRGLEAAGIGVEAIPSLEEMDARLQKIGWRAVAVRGFIPPAVFTEMQALGVLAIAADIRGHRHIDYTPAPDIVHESAGHAPILADPRYAAYVRRCGVAGVKAIASREDQAVFEAIRNLSVVKEDPAATGADAAAAQDRLRAAQAARSHVSESTRASRLYWWTAEYGLVGSLEQPRIYGAGLLSSLGEAAQALTDRVTRLPLTLDCVEQDFDITRMQPQLYVARDFEQLFEVLEAFEATLSWRRGGRHGLEEARRAGTVVHLILDSGLQLSGRVSHCSDDLARLAGPVQAARDGRALGPAWPGPALVAFGPGALPEAGAFRLELAGGTVLSGFRHPGGEAVHLQGSQDGQPLELPDRAMVYLAASLAGVAGGAADPEAWDRLGGGDRHAEGDAERLARQRKGAALPADLAALYREVAALRRSGHAPAARLGEIRSALRSHPDDWLLALEVEELLAAPGSPRTVGAAAGPPSLERP